MKSFTLLMAQYKKQHHERLGQFFINRYFNGGTWPELFETLDDEKAANLIQLWLIENDFTQELPVYTATAPAISFRLSFSPTRNQQVRLEHQQYPSEFHRNSGLPINRIFNGNNLSESLSTKADRFAYGHAAIVATINIPKDASDELRASAIKALEASMLAQGKIYARQSNKPFKQIRDMLVSQFPSVESYPR